MKQDELLSTISGDIEMRDLWQAIKHMENYLALHPHQINSDRLFAIKTDYQMMMEYWRNGFKDPQVPQLYEKLLHRMYVLYANVATKARILQSPLLASLLMKVHMSPRDWSIQVVREQLESFVSDIAMLDLEPKHTAHERRKNLHRQHHQLLSELFAYILTTDLWSDGQGEEIEQLLLSPTVDSFDQQVIISAITLAAINCYDMVKFRTLIHVYQQATDQYVRQRALVGWVFSIDLNVEEFLFPEMGELVRATLQDADCMKEFIELQKQVYFCLSADEDRNVIQNEIMPDMIRGQNLNITRGGVMEQDEESTLNDILHPDAEEEKLEKMEAGFRKMVDMQKQGSDVYFGGFSQMKRFPFFNEIINWFTPYYIDHPGIAQAVEKFGGETFLKKILDYGPFCNSDKYSFVLAFETVLNQIPANVREMLNKGEAEMVQKMDDAEMKSPAYIRRIYLQDLFRFFRLNPVRNEFYNVFGEHSHKCLFIKDPLLDGTDHQAYYKEIATFLIKRNRKEDAKTLMSSLYEEQYMDYDYHMLMAYLGNDPKLHYEMALKLNPQSERALQGLGRQLFQDEYYDQALNVYNQLVEINPDKKSYQLNKSVCLTNVQRYDEAEQILFKLNYEDPDNLNVARVLAWTLTCDGKYEQAGRLYDQLMDDVITATGDWINYGYYLWFSGKITEAANCFRRYIVDNFTSENRWNESYHITRREQELCNVKGITDEEIQMMTDLIDF